MSNKMTKIKFDTTKEQNERVIQAHERGDFDDHPFSACDYDREFHGELTISNEAVGICTADDGIIAWACDDETATRLIRLLNAAATE